MREKEEWKDWGVVVKITIYIFQLLNLEMETIEEEKQGTEVKKRFGLCQYSHVLKLSEALKIDRDKPSNQNLIPLKMKLSKSQ